MNFEVIGYIAGICTALCFLPQTIKTISLPDVKGLSAFSYAVYNIGILGWIIYGVCLNSLPMVVFNSISLVFSGTILYLILKHR